MLEATSRAAWTAVFAVFATGCLVSDPRPTPGSVAFTASSDSQLQNGFTTSDAWIIRYQRFLVSLGHVSPEGDACTFYSDAAYNRVLDMRQSGAQRLSVLYALGTCSIDFEVSSPSEDSVLGGGVTRADRDFMRTPASDADVVDAGISIYVAGTATSGRQEKKFAWAFRKRVDYTSCYFDRDGERVYGVELTSNESIARDLAVHGATPFQDRLDATQAAQLFAPFVAADAQYGNNDGSITLDELGLVPLADISTGDHYADADPTWKSLEDYLYRGLFSQIVRYQGDGQSAELEIFPNDRVLR